MHKRTWEKANTDIWDEPKEEAEKLSPLIQAMVIGHSMNRLLKQFDFHIVSGGKSERNNNFDKVLLRINKMLKSREKTNLKDFIFAEEYEKILWKNTTYSYDKKTPIFAINVVSSLYEYFSSIMLRYANLNENIMEKLSMIHSVTDIDSKEFFDIEQNDSSFINTYIKIFEPHSGVGVKKSLFSGKKLTLKNNLIIEGKKIAEEFE